MYHTDIDLNVPVKLMDGKLKWQDVQVSIVKAVWEYTNLQEIKVLNDKLKETRNDNENERGSGMGR